MKNIELLEDKVVKFGDDTTVFPKFGWACVLAGGAGSGKGYNFSRYIPIQGKLVDVDNLKKFTETKLSEVSYSYDTDTYYIRFTSASEEPINSLKKNYKGNIISDIKDNGDGTKTYTINLTELGIGKPYNNNNPAYLSFVHTLTRDLSKKYRDIVFKNFGGTKDRLPNIILDATMSELKDYEVFKTLKNIGYKTCLVYVFTKIDRAINQNEKRGSSSWVDETGKVRYGRRVDYNLLLKLHRDSLSTLGKIKNDKSITKYIDDAWIIISNESGAPNTMRIKADNGSFDLTTVEADINDNISNITKIMSDNESYIGESYIGAYDLYKALEELHMLSE